MLAVNHYNVVNGIKLHRKIDLFSDQSDIFRKSCKSIKPEQRRFSRILIDMYFDHIPARHWSQLHSKKLIDFSQHIYQVVLKDRPENTQNFRKVSRLIVEQDWFRTYTSIDGIAQQIERLGSRLKRGNALLGGAIDLVRHLNSFELDFFQFIEEAEEFSDDYAKKLTFNNDKA
ncbi:MAG: ACP phosphodiesterase [Proteobacteria bacterium]|nr:ACP phosphodiesterase [Pseudomonadota bacterium]MDA1331647.1 ACP phosphodiesterase [Pseudomonadota bacterium]